MLSISRLAVVSSVLAVFVAASCGQQEKGPTYHKEIATIMASQCAECHQVGGIGPFPLTTYAEVKAHKDEIAFATGARLMPPSNIDASGSCRTFQDSRWLTDEQIKDIKEWA
ncbi:MAG TPA: cytochrome c, partial [Myxococcota bacterium]